MVHERLIFFYLDSFFFTLWVACKNGAYVLVGIRDMSHLQPCVSIEQGTMHFTSFRIKKKERKELTMAHGVGFMIIGSRLRRRCAFGIFQRPHSVIGRTGIIFYGLLLVGKYMLAGQKYCVSVSIEDIFNDATYRKHHLLPRYHTRKKTKKGEIFAGGRILGGDELENKLLSEKFFSNWK